MNQTDTLDFIGVGTDKPRHTEPTHGSYPYQRHSATSKAAAIAIEPRAGTQRARVLAHLRDMEDCGATDEEIQRTLPMSANSQRPRRQELVNACLVVDSGRKRKTSAYFDAVVWIASEFAV